MTDHGIYHRTPYVARLLYEFNLNPMYGTLVEENPTETDAWVISLANVKTNMGILVKYDPTLYP